MTTINNENIFLNNYKNCNEILITASLLNGENDFIRLGTSYSQKNNIIDSIIFSISGVNRLIDIEKELAVYEAKNNMKSDDFYTEWKSNTNMDKNEFNKWADIYKLYRDVKNC